ncbi:sulfur carrier protein ThiS adenylyltransferase ThiF [Campylobacter mucosalis]|uniref:sulfur carrier protein ThiS adenylyltransferase ThiF n=1 Tax=Campylobacter mucosalis TaxID=202 RepID=UPI00146FDEA7|nr:sulfur carrier protein ThiS adenylyltransferase ThiF [Campylobacter mucosalis]
MIEVSINGFHFSTNSTTTAELRAEFLDKSSEISAFLTKHDLANADIFILNGFATTNDVSLNNGDKITIIKRGVMPDLEILRSMIEARNTPELNNALKNACIGVAGLGGLGSNIALSLARAGVAKLIVADFDVVEPSNLNRQQYYVRHIGLKKTQAIKELIADVNPFVKVIAHDVKIDANNVSSVFSPCSIICEAFDNVVGKHMFLTQAANSLKDKQIICGSGMAGHFSSNLIKTTKFAKNVYICGDMKNEAKFHQGLMAPRVGICANHQANMALRLLMGLAE